MIIYIFIDIYLYSLPTYLVLSVCHLSILLCIAFVSIYGFTTYINKIFSFIYYYFYGFCALFCSSLYTNVKHLLEINCTRFHHTRTPKRVLYKSTNLHSVTTSLSTITKFINNVVVPRWGQG